MLVWRIRFCRFFIIFVESTFDVFVAENPGDTDGKPEAEVRARKATEKFEMVTVTIEGGRPGHATRPWPPSFCFLQINHQTEDLL